MSYVVLSNMSYVVHMNYLFSSDIVQMQSDASLDAYEPAMQLAQVSSKTIHQ